MAASWKEICISILAPSVCHSIIEIYFLPIVMLNIGRKSTLIEAMGLLKKKTHFN